MPLILYIIEISFISKSDEIVAEPSPLILKLKLDILLIETLGFNSAFSQSVVPALNAIHLSAEPLPVLEPSVPLVILLKAKAGVSPSTPY